MIASLNPLFRMAQESHDLEILGVLSTLVFFGAFLAWSWWALAPRFREHWEAAGRIPFDDDDARRDGRGGDA